MTSAVWRLACAPAAAAVTLALISGCTEPIGDGSARSSAPQPSSSSSPAPTAARSSAVISASPTPTGTAPEEPQKAEEEIRETWLAFFDTDTEIDDKVDLVENGEQNELMVSGLFADRLGKNLRAAVTTVTFLSSLRARVDYTLALGGKLLPVTEPGASVRQDKKWKVALSTVCELTEYGEDAPPAPSCDESP